LGHSVSYTNLEDGIWYFHIKAKKGNVWGGVTHYILKIDSTPPAAFNLNFESSAASIISTQYPIISFVTTDALSGIDHYELKSINLGKTGDGETGETEFFVEATSPYRLSLDSGPVQVIVRAHDKAGNWRDTSEKIQVLPLGKFIITREGVQFWVIFLKWWLIILILGLLVIIGLIIIFLSRKYHLKIYEERERIKGTKEKADGRKEEIRKRMNLDRYS